MHLSMVIVLCGGIITHFHGQQGDIRLRTGETTHEFLSHGQWGTVIPETLPFHITLADFRIEQDDVGHTNYISTVIVRGLSGTDTVCIAMNRPLIVCGYRMIQTSYDEDLHGTHLSVINDPIGTGTALLGYGLFLMAAAWLLAGKAATALRRDRPHSLGTTERLAALSVTVLSLLPLVPLFTAPLRPILRTPLLYIHVGTIMAAYILLVLSIWRRNFLATATLLLATGIVLGSVWGSISWGSYWSWDPKETWALVTLLLYSLPLHTHHVPMLRRPSVYRIYSTLCLLSLLITYLGVNFFMQSRHSYL